jgi:hypothetical protein
MASAQKSAELADYCQWLFRTAALPDGTCNSFTLDRVKRQILKFRKGLRPADRRYGPQTDRVPPEVRPNLPPKCTCPATEALWWEAGRNLEEEVASLSPYIGVACLLGLFDSVGCQLPAVAPVQTATQRAW